MKTRVRYLPGVVSWAEHCIPIKDGRQRMLQRSTRGPEVVAQENTHQMRPVYFFPVYLLETPSGLSSLNLAPSCLCITAESGLPSNLDSYLSLDERPLNGFKDQLCSLVFMALTDPSTQLQLVGIRTFAVLGAQPGTLKRKRKGRVLVVPCDFLSSVKSNLNSLVLNVTVGDLKIFFFFFKI